MPGWRGDDQRSREETSQPVVRAEPRKWRRHRPGCSGQRHWTRGASRRVASRCVASRFIIANQRLPSPSTKGLPPSPLGRSPSYLSRRPPAIGCLAASPHHQRPAPPSAAKRPRPRPPLLPGRRYPGREGVPRARCRVCGSEHDTFALTMCSSSPSARPGCRTTWQRLPRRECSRPKRT